MSEKIVIRPQNQYKETTYQVVYYDEHGKRRKQTKKTKLEAENFRQQLYDQRNRRQAVEQLKAQGIVVGKAHGIAEPKDISAAFKEFYNAKLAAVLDPKDLTSLKQEKQTYNLFGVFIVEERKRNLVEEITLLDLEVFREKLQKKNLKNATVVRKETSVRAFLNYCLAHKYVTENVADGLKKLPIVQPKRKLYSDDEIAKLLEKMDSWAADLFMVLQETMARPVELERATIGDIDWQEREIRLVSSKGGRVIERLVPLTDDAVMQLRRVVLKRHLEKRGESSDRIFVNSIGNPVSTDAFDRAVRRARVAAKLDKGATPYALRHAGLNALKRLRIPMASIGAIAGHRKASTTMQYMQESKEDLRNVIDLMDASKKKKAQQVS